jgi:hypothetical protein
MTAHSGSTAERVAEVRARIAAAARGAGRVPGAVTLVAVSKGFPAPAIAEVLAEGVADVGENRAQDLVAKAGEVAVPVWHFLGAVQRNKIARLAPLVAWWHGVDRIEVARALAGARPDAQVLVEVNIAGEPQKAGCPPAAVARLVDGARAIGLDVAGLMTVPPAGEDPRPHFAALRALAATVEVAGLSMGMSDDFETAVAEGATIVRIGRAIFGERPGVGVRAGSRLRTPGLPR